MGVFDFFKRVLPLSDNDQYCLELLKGEEEYEPVKRIIKEKRAKFLVQKFNLSIFKDSDHFQLVSELPALNELLIKVNAKLKLTSQKVLFSEFADSAFSIVKKIIGSNVAGMESAKSAVALQLFANEDLHILIFGENHTKKELINNAAYISPISAVSKASNVVGDNVLYQANGGICAIHELLIMHRLDKSDFYNAMSQGYLIKDKMRYETRTRILATSTPSGGLERTFEGIRRQLPGSKIINEFNLIFLSRLTGQVYKIAMKNEDRDFIKDYITYAKTIEVKISKELEDHLNKFITALKTKQHYFFMDVSDKLFNSLIILAKASARSRLKSTVEVLDIERAKEIVLEGLKGN